MRESLEQKNIAWGFLFVKMDFRKKLRMQWGLKTKPTHVEDTGANCLALLFCGWYDKEMK